MQTNGPPAAGSHPAVGALDSEELLQRFARRVIHNVSNPLAAILGCSQLIDRLLARGTPGDLDQCREYAQLIQAEAQRCSRLLEDLAWLARPPDPQLAEVNLHDVANQAIAAFDHPEAVRIELERGPGDLTLAVDADWVVRVIHHLLQNAVDAMPEGGTITVRAEGAIDDAGQRRLVVADNGPGIPADVLPRTMEPFFTTRQGRNGVGLAICERLVSLQGGTMRVVSSPGSGTQAIIEWTPERCH